MGNNHTFVLEFYKNDSFDFPFHQLNKIEYVIIYKSPIII